MTSRTQPDRNFIQSDRFVLSQIHKLKLVVYDLTLF